MTNEEAKFILRAARPGGEDSADPAMKEALAQADRDPILKSWLERERAFDGHMIAECRKVAAPAHLRDAILAGARASQPPRSWRRVWWSTAGLAASMALILGVVAITRVQATPGAYLDELVQHALGEMSGPHPRGVPLERFAAIGGYLRDSSKPLGTELPVDLESLRKDGCRTIQVSGREVFEICFRRDAWYHLYIASRGDFMCRECEVEPMFRERGEVASVTWVDDEHVYVLVSKAGLDAVKRTVTDPSALAMR